MREKTKFGFILTKCAFTLAEVLITLGIIGVVAALTIPSLMTNYKAKRLRTQFLKSYSTAQQVFKQMESDDVPLDPTQYGKTAETKFYRTFMNYLQAPMDCGSYAAGFKKISPCYDVSSYIQMKPYKTYNNKSSTPIIILDDGQIVLQDGSQLFFENAVSNNYIWISVDLNGYNNPPNRWGYDLFTFQFLDGELRPMGNSKTQYNNMDAYCSKDSNSAYNGIACAQKAKDDTDYFKKIVKEFK